MFRRAEFRPGTFRIERAPRVECRLYKGRTPGRKVRAGGAGYVV